MSDESVFVVDTDPNKHLPAFTVCPKKSKNIFLNLNSEASEYHSNFKEKKIFHFTTGIHFWDILFWFTFYNLGVVMTVQSEMGIFE